MRRIFIFYGHPLDIIIEYFAKDVRGVEILNWVVVADRDCWKVDDLGMLDLHDDCHVVLEVTFRCLQIFHIHLHIDIHIHIRIRIHISNISS